MCEFSWAEWKKGLQEWVYPIWDEDINEWIYSLRVDSVDALRSRLDEIDEGLRESNQFKVDSSNLEEEMIMSDSASVSIHIHIRKEGWTA